MDYKENCKICGAENLRREMIKTDEGNYYCDSCKEDVISKFLLMIDELSDEEFELIAKINWDSGFI